MGVTAAALIGTQVLSGLLNYKAQQSQYNAQIDAYNAQARAAQQNALITERQNTRVAEQYANEQRKLNDKRRLIAGQNAAAAGASGIVGSAGSAADMLDAIDIGYKQDSQDLLSRQREDTWSNYVRQVNFENQARAYQSAADNINRQKRASLMSTLIGTAANVYGTVAGLGGTSKTGSSGIYGSDYGLGRSDNGISLNGFGSNLTASVNNRKVSGNNFTNMGWLK